MNHLQHLLHTPKARFSAAAAACLEGRPGAAAAADQARREVDALLTALARKSSSV